MKDAKDMLLPAVSPEVASRLARVESTPRFKLHMKGSNADRSAPGPPQRATAGMASRAVPKDRSPHKPHILALDERSGPGPGIENVWTPRCQQIHGCHWNLSSSGTGPNGMSTASRKFRVRFPSSALFLSFSFTQTDRDRVPTRFAGQARLK